MLTCRSQTQWVPQQRVLRVWGSSKGPRSTRGRHQHFSPSNILRNVCLYEANLTTLCEIPSSRATFYHFSRVYSLVCDTIRSRARRKISRRGTYRSLPGTATTDVKTQLFFFSSRAAATIHSSPRCKGRSCNCPIAHVTRCYISAFLFGPLNWFEALPKSMTPIQRHPQALSELPHWDYGQQHDKHWSKTSLPSCRSGLPRGTHDAILLQDCSRAEKSRARHLW